MQLSDSDRRSYYHGALRTLRYCEQRRPTGRRFDNEADNLWQLFHGDLLTADRIDLLIRDADAEWPGSFGARGVFAIRATAEDEPFGVDWASLDPVRAEETWRAIRAEEVPADPGKALGALARSWELELAPFELAAPTPTDKLVVVGPSATAAVIAAFVDGTDLDWAEQVICVATPPAHRHVACAGPALVNGTKATRLVAANESIDVPPGAQLVASDDATNDDAAWAKGLVEGLEGGA